MCIGTRCLHPTPTDRLPIPEGILLDELHRQGATLSLAYSNVMDPNHLLHHLMVGPTSIQERDYDLDTFCACGTQAAQ